MKPAKKWMKRLAQLPMSPPARSMMKLSKLMSPLQKLPNRKKRQNRQSNTKQPIKERRTCHVL